MVLLEDIWKRLVHLKVKKCLYETHRIRFYSFLFPITISFFFLIEILFWLHHAFVDLKWEMHQAAHGVQFDGIHYANAGKGEQYRNIAASSVMDPWGVSISSVLTAKQVCVSYQAPNEATIQQAVKAQKDSIAAGEKIKLPTVNESWLKQAGASQAEIDKLRKETEAIAAKANESIAKNMGGKTSASSTDEKKDDIGGLGEEKEDVQLRDQESKTKVKNSGKCRTAGGRLAVLVGVVVGLVVSFS